MLVITFLFLQVNYRFLKTGNKVGRILEVRMGIQVTSIDPGTQNPANENA
jgi:hypothetical protein